MTCPQCGEATLVHVHAWEDGACIEEPIMLNDGSIGRQSRPASFDACSACEYAAEAGSAPIRPYLTRSQQPDMTIKIIPNDGGTPVGKLADVELHFSEGPLAGLKLIGFAVWERRGGGRNVTFPARQYSVNGERRSFALLRPTSDTNAQNGIRDLILQAYAEYETPVTS